jgi:hypothetical protein
MGISTHITFISTFRGKNVIQKKILSKKVKFYQKIPIFQQKSLKPLAKCSKPLAILLKPLTIFA